MAEKKITQPIQGPFGRDEDFWRANIVNSFLSFGYEPTEAEVAQLIPTSAGTGGFERGQAAVADYVRTMQAEQERQANDPLKGFIEEQKPKIGQYEQQAQNLYEELRGVISKAPQLFGALNEAQIDQLLAPLQRATAESSARVEGAFGRRGLVGSTPEAQALAEQERIFRENALSTGLQVGLNQQKAERDAIQNYLNQVFARSGELTQLVGQGAGQLSGQDLQQLQFLSGLPLLERGVAANERAQAEAAAAANKTDWGSIGSLAGMVGGAALAPFTGGASMLPFLLGAGGALGGTVGNIAGGKPTLAAGSAGQIPWWMMLNQNLRTPQTTSNAIVPENAINFARNVGYGNTGGKLSLTGRY